jgi:type I restriction enzyme M protein
MPKKKSAPKPSKSFEESLWETATKLRGSVESSEYKHVVLSLIFLKFVSDKFEERRAQLIAEGQEAYVDMAEFYTMQNAFYLPETSRWSYIQQHAKQDDIAVKIDSDLTAVEKSNASLKGALPDNYFSRLGLDGSKLTALIDAINNIDTVEDKEEDVVGRVYEYFLGKLGGEWSGATSTTRQGCPEGERGAVHQFYTPKYVVNLIAEMIEPYKGKLPRADHGLLPRAHTRRSGRPETPRFRLGFLSVILRLRRNRPTAEHARSGFTPITRRQTNRVAHLFACTKPSQWAHGRR